MGRDAKERTKPALINPPRRRRGVWWWGSRSVAVLVMLLATGVVLVTQTAILTDLVVPTIERETGLEITSARVTLDPFGELVLEDAVMRAPNIDGLGGELIRLRRADIAFDWTRILSGAGAITRVRLEGPALRVSQDTKTGEVNLAALNLGSGSGGTIPTPRIVIDRGLLELGEHDDGAYTRLKRLSVAGELGAPDADGVAELMITARHTGPAISATGADAPISITGEVASDGTIVARMDGLTLEDWPPEIVPSRVREWYAALDLAGDTGTAEFRIGPDGRITAALGLEGVDLNLPIKPAADAPGEVEPLRMRDTRGELRFGPDELGADLDGKIDRLGYSVKLTTRGRKPDSGFEATITTTARIDETFPGFHFIPPDITDALDKFKGVAMDAEATIKLTRAEPDGAPAPIEVSGRAEITNGRAAYRDFPYPVEDIDAEVSFTDNEVIIERMAGRGRTGARLEGSGAFRGFGDDARVELDITGRGMPIDDELLGALDSNERELVETLFAEREHAELVERGLVLAPDTRDVLEARRRRLADRSRALAELPTPDEDEIARLSAEIAEIDRRLDIPVFDFGGALDLDLSIQRDPQRPEDEDWITDIDATLTRAGIVPEQFPLPIVAEDVRLSVREGLVTLSGGTYSGIDGGWASVEARVVREDEGGDTPPTIEIEAGDIPIDQRLIAAIPGADSAGDEQGGLSLGRMLDQLRLDGTVACDADIGPRDNGELGYDIEASITDGSARPLPPAGAPEDAGSRLAIDVAFGTIYVTESIIVVSLDGAVRPENAPGTPADLRLTTQLTLPPRPVEGPEPALAGPPTPGPRLFSIVRAENLDLALRVEDALGIVSPGFGARADAIRSAHAPSGVIGLRAQLEGYVGGSLDAEILLEHLEDLRFELGGRAYGIERMEGFAEARTGLETRVGFTGVRLPVTVDGRDAAIVELDGALPLARAGELIELEDEPSLELNVRDGRLGSPGVRDAIGRLGMDRIDAFLDDYGVGGRVGLDATITPPDQTRIAPGAPGAYTLPRVAVAGEITPHTLSLDRAGATLELTVTEGRVPFDARGGRLDGISAEGSGGTRIDVDGSWRVADTGGVDLDAEMSAASEDVHGSVRAAMPDAVLGVMDRLELRVDGEVDLGRMTIGARALGTPRASYDIGGEASLGRVSLRLGVPITDMDTGAVFTVASGARGGLTYDIDLDADRLRAGPLRLHNARVAIEDDPRVAAGVRVPEFRAGMHGGIISGSASAGPRQGDDTWIETDLRASGVRAAPVFNDLGLVANQVEGPPPPWNITQDLSRGAMTASMNLSGPASDRSRWVGRGRARIAGGAIVDLPGLINLIEASNLAIPSGSTLDLAEADLYLEGAVMALERVSISSSNVEILGYGTFDWTSRALDLRFRSRSIDKIPLVSAALEGIRDELITTRVSGVLGSLEYDAEQFGTARRLIDAMLGRPQSDQQRRLNEVRRRSRVGSGRLRESTDETLERPTRTTEPATGGVVSTTDASDASE